MFASDAKVSLEKEINKAHVYKRTNPEDIEREYEIDKCTMWIRNNGYHKVCLQFPDSLLGDSSEVAFRLQNNTDRPVYVMGDTAYESCCVDYVSAGHVDADAIIHYGPACYSTVADTTPCLYVYEKRDVDVAAVGRATAELIAADGAGREGPVVVVVDLPYAHRLDELATIVRNDVTVVRADRFTSTDGAAVCLFVGRNDRRLMNVASKCDDGSYVCYFDPDGAARPQRIVPYATDVAASKRRNYLVEKIKDARTIGIVVGTLAVKNYLNVVERIKTLCKVNGKKYYVVSVGKPTVAKLANFPEIDVYVVISCIDSDIYESRDFYRPIVTPYDAELAMNPRARPIRFTYDYNVLLDDGLDGLTADDMPPNDVSLLTGRIRGSAVADAMRSIGDDDDDDDCGTLATKTDGAVALHSAFGAGYLARRSWKGLERNVGLDDVEAAVDGRRGVAQRYENEL